MTINAVGAVLLISDDAAALAEFYRATLGFPLEDEVHEGITLHYGCEIGGVHFAIHPAAEWPGERRLDGQSPVLVFYTDDIAADYDRLVANRVSATPPFDHGFAVLTAFRDPDGNNVQVMQLA